MISYNQSFSVLNLVDAPLVHVDRGRRCVDFRLFSVVAALSEAVVALDAHTRNCLEKLELHALNVKLQQAKNLFYCFDVDGTVGLGILGDSLSHGV